MAFIHRSATNSIPLRYHAKSLDVKNSRKNENNYESP